MKLIITLIIFVSVSAFAAETAQLSGVLKVRLYEDHSFAYYLQINDEEKVHIAKRTHAVDMRKYVNQNVTLEAELRKKTIDQPSNFIRRIIQLKSLNKGPDNTSKKALVGGGI
ncbi:hypothetical protein PQO03_05520 [Lentisphaera profundi]|uniref:Uncharacterized protein n=1 Tax=Lentisphaera profundi TaxID=1658616 RepID=A0ABY7VZE0_9BACT|nr:hypothetical protein [Lentisphaera profundi]WDE97408.1 hypothetical protein PQO03_05520 [Lentisphaera profundi]